MAKTNKKKKEEVAVKKAKTTSLDVARKAIEKKYGVNVISTMGEKGSLVVPTVSSGCLSLDSALGKGGFAMGRVYEIFGPPSGGKTTLTMSVIAEAQRRGLVCAFVDAERAADPALFKAMGVDVDKLIVIEAFSGDENLDALEMLMETGEIDVAVVDSVSALIPQAEADANMEDQFIGLLARLMSKAMRKFVPLAGKTNTMLLFINQVRNKIGSYGDPEVTTGGVALDFSATGRIKVIGGASKSSRIVDELGNVQGHHTEFSVVKNKLGKPYRKAKVPLVYGVGYDTHWECLSMAVDLGIIDKAGAWFSYNGDNIGQGEVKTLAYLKDNPEVYTTIRESVIECLGLKRWYEANE